MNDWTFSGDFLATLWKFASLPKNLVLISAVCFPDEIASSIEELNYFKITTLKINMSPKQKGPSQTEISSSNLFFQATC